MAKMKLLSYYLRDKLTRKIHRTLLAKCKYISLTLALITTETYAELVVSYVPLAQTPTAWESYEVDILTLGLEKTKSEYGAYRLVPLKASSRARMLRDIESNRYKNFVQAFGYTRDRLAAKNTTYVKFPIYRGLFGYRICFVNKDAKARVAAAQSLDQIRAFSHVQGKDWSDFDILTHNSFNIKGIKESGRLIRMVANGQVDLFCRAVNELKREYQDNGDTPGLMVDTSMALYYPHPRYFLTNRANTDMIERLEKGLRIAYNDGSLLALWEKVNGPSIEYGKLETRKTYVLDNPFLEGMDFDFEAFAYHPPGFDHQK